MKDERDELREDLEDISLNDEDLEEDLGEDLSGEDMSVDETDNSSGSGDKKKGSANGNKKKFPVIAVVGLIIVIIGVAVLGLVLGKKKTQNNNSRVARAEVVEETIEVEAPTKASSQSAEEILARVRGENQDILVDATSEAETEKVATEPETDENGETVETTFNRGTRTEEIELENEDKYSVIVEKPTVNYKDIEYSQDIEATYTITKFKQKNKEIFYAEQGDEKFKVDRVDVVAEGSISGLTGTWELTLPYSVDWKLGDMITITYKMGEIDSSSRAIIDLKVKDYNKIESGVVTGDKNKKITKAVIPNS